MRHAVEYNTPNEKGFTKRDHLKQVGREVIDPEVNPLGEYLLAIFWDISSGRSIGGFGATRLTWLDLNAWSNMTGVLLNSDELALVRLMDATFVTALNKKAPKNG